MGSGTAGAEDLPPGFTDGVVAGSDDPTPAAEVPITASGAGADEVGTAATTMRYFGREPYLAVRAAAEVAPRTCTMSVDGLTALVLAPVFKESSAATTPLTAPAPMTLSRYDEWSGTYGTTTSANANYGLYAFRDPYTVYPRAYWHPGIGIWQYDSAGLGAPFTTVEAMQVSTVAADVARAMAARYCNPPTSLVGHGAPFTEQERRYAAWGDWGYPCTLCQQYFQEMTSTTPRFANLGLVDGISELGGTVQRTCALSGVPGTMPCWYVQPVVGTIQGATAWATLSPQGGSGPTVAPAPLSYPFYVVDRGATEERHWLRNDTGYGIDIKASRQIGKNARPRSNQVGSGLTWANTSGLCDLTSGRGACVTADPVDGLSSILLSIGGDFRTTSLDANGDGRGDVLLYAPGTDADALWLSTGPQTFQPVPLEVTKEYDTVRSLDVDGDGNDDLLWYDRASGAAALWRFTSLGTFTSTVLTPGPNRIPLPMDLNQGVGQEIFWYGPGGTSDSVWAWTGTGFSTSARTVNGTYTPIVGDFDDNGRDDILWYTTDGADSVWYHALAGGFTARTVTITRAYRTTVGDLDGDGHSDIVFHAPGSGADSIWFGGAVGSFSYQTFAVNRTYTPFTADLYGTGRDSVIWFSPTAADDVVWTWTAGRTLGTEAASLRGTRPGLVGSFSVGSTDGVLWYGPGSEPDSLWYR